MGTSLVKGVLILGNRVFFYFYLLWGTEVCFICFKQNTTCFFVLKEQSREASGCKAWGAEGEGREIPGAHWPASPSLLGKFQASEERPCLKTKQKLRVFEE